MIRLFCCDGLVAGFILRGSKEGGVALQSALCDRGIFH